MEVLGRDVLGRIFFESWFVKLSSGMVDSVEQGERSSLSLYVCDAWGACSVPWARMRWEGTCGTVKALCSVSLLPALHDRDCLGSGRFVSSMCLRV